MQPKNVKKAVKKRCQNANKILESCCFCGSFVCKERIGQAHVSGVCVSFLLFCAASFELFVGIILAVFLSLFSCFLASFELFFAHLFSRVFAYFYMFLVSFLLLFSLILEVIFEAFLACFGVRRGAPWARAPRLSSTTAKNT